jgi:hypothetical protein
MSIDIEYAIKQDIRNNPVVREIDRAQRREFLRSLVIAGLVVGMLLFSAKQHFQLVRNGYEVELKRAELAAAEALNRQLRLQYEMQRAPDRVGVRAKRELRMVEPTTASTVILERATTPDAPRAVVAGIR